MNKIDKDKKVIRIMIECYCKSNHKTTHLCQECEELLHYAYIRIEKCPHGNKKTSCRKCEIHCYSSDKKEAIRRVMRFSGPRMILSHPFIAIEHLIKEKF